MSWEIHNNVQSPDLVARVNSFIQNQYGLNFTGNWMLVGFWEDVSPDNEMYTNVSSFNLFPFK